MTDIYDLRTGQLIATYSLPPNEAVGTAYRQLVFNDWNWWEERKGKPVPLVEEGQHFYFCGHLAAKKEQVINAH